MNEFGERSRLVRVSDSQETEVARLCSIIQAPQKNLGHPQYDCDLYAADAKKRLNAGHELASLVRIILGLVLALVLVGCGGPIREGTLVTTIPNTQSQVQIAAEFWNQNGGNWQVSYGACTEEPCVYIVLGDCAETDPVLPGQSKACFTGDMDPPRIEIQPAVLEDPRVDLALSIAHEVGHVMGYEHGGPGNVMSPKGEESAWAVP